MHKILETHPTDKLNQMSRNSIGLAHSLMSIHSSTTCMYADSCKLVADAEYIAAYLQ